jgi:MoaA/NifB/PqqE/SkfB family radical SAM enzyme
VILDQREQKRRLLLRLKGIEAGRPLIGPATVQLHLTDLCNLACKYCYYYGPDSTHRPTGKNHLPYEVFESITRDCAKLKVDAIYLSGQGDPTLHPCFYDMLRHLETSFAVTIYSNGTFPIERCRDILRADRIVINLGEADRESYRDLQGRDLFVKVIKNIRELARLKPQWNPNFCIEVVFIVTRLNAQSHLRTEALVRKLGANVLKNKVAEISEHNRHIMFSDQEEKAGISGEWPPCYHGWFYSAIKLNGDVNVCCFMQRLTIGNAFTTSFKDIWESDEYARARISALKGDPFRNYHECINCRASWRNKEIASQLDRYNRVLKV